MSQVEFGLNSRTQRVQFEMTFADLHGSPQPPAANPDIITSLSPSACYAQDEDCHCAVDCFLCHNGFIHLELTAG